MLLNFAFLSQKLIDSKEMFLKFWMISAKSVVSFICDEISHKKLLFVAATSSLRGRILEGFWAEKLSFTFNTKIFIQFEFIFIEKCFHHFSPKKNISLFFFICTQKLFFSPLVLTIKSSSTSSLLPFFLMQKMRKRKIYFFPSNFTFVAVIFSSFFSLF